MTLRYGNIIRHERAMDVAFEISKVTGPYGPNQKIEITGRWINMGFVESFHLHVLQKIKLSKEELKYWQFCLEPRAKCIRYAKWHSISG